MRMLFGLRRRRLPEDTPAPPEAPVWPSVRWCNEPAHLEVSAVNSCLRQSCWAVSISGETFRQVCSVVVTVQAALRLSGLAAVDRRTVASTVPSSAIGSGRQAAYVGHSSPFRTERDNRRAPRHTEVRSAPFDRASRLPTCPDLASGMCVVSAQSEHGSATATTVSAKDASRWAPDAGCRCPAWSPCSRSLQP